MSAERDLLLCLFNAVGALAERMTGKKMLLCVKNTDGEWFHVYPETQKVTWLPAAVDQYGHYAVLAPMRCPVHDMPDAMPQERDPSLERMAMF